MRSESDEQRRESVGEITDYGLQCPTEEDAIAKLERVLGAGRGRELWARICAEAGLDRAVRPLDLEQLATAADALASVEGLPGVLGIALKVRIETYSCLAKTQRGGDD